jgi:hypothetical protein
MEALRLPRLCRQVCARAGLPLPPAPAAGERFVLRCGAEPPGLFAELLEEAFVEDEAEVVLWPEHGAPDYRSLPPGHVAVRAGFDSPCPAAGELRRAASPGGGRVLLFAVERRDAAGRLLGVTWAGVPEEEPPPQAPFRAAVLRVGAGPAAGDLTG